MTQLYKLDDLAGKTIVKAKDVDEMHFIFFTDDTFIVQHAYGWEDKYIEVYDKPFDLLPKADNIDILHHLDIIDEQTYHQMKAVFDADEVARKKQNDLKLLASLKEKYKDV